MLALITTLELQLYFYRYTESLCESFRMISNQTLYTLANTLGVCAMLSVIAYHFLAVNAKYLGRQENGAVGHN